MPSRPDPVRALVRGTLTLALACTIAATALANPHRIELTHIGTYHSGVFNQSAAEIVAHDPGSQRLFVVNAASGQLDVLDIRNPAEPLRLFTIDLSDYGSASACSA